MPSPSEPLARNFSMLKWAEIGARLALAVSFLSAVADRFGLWGGPDAPGVAWGDYPSFLLYAEKLLPWLPQTASHLAAGVATTLELGFAGMLLTGFQVKRAAQGSAGLLLCFASAMSVHLGPKAALDYSVWSAASAGLLLAYRGEPAA